MFLLGRDLSFKLAEMQRKDVHPSAHYPVPVIHSGEKWGNVHSFFLLSIPPFREILLI